MLLYASVIFLGAFLLFQIQPLIAKIILPSFGGSSVVWSTCMLFFQVLLLGGYAYAHWLNEYVRPRRQALLHSVLLLASLAALPVSPDAARRVTAVDHPSWQILSLLAITIGAPYFLLSATSPLLQAWYARRRGTAIPYRLYALSNLASMLALLTYPVLVEPNLTTRLQGRIWSLAYVGFAIACAATAWHGVRAGAEKTHEETAPVTPAEASPGWPLRVFWIALASCASILLLSVTTFLTQDVAAIPFLWIVPLSVYLLTFIICFDSPRVYFRPVFIPLLVAALAMMGYLLRHPTSKFAIGPTIFLSVASLFFFCMVCHGELVRLKPHPRYLTVFYVMLSIGGAIGGLFVALIAPNLFNGYQEFPIGLAMCAILAAIVLIRSDRLLPRPVFRWAFRAALAGLVAMYVVSLATTVRDSIEGYLLVRRNFYGQLRVRDRIDPDEHLTHRVLLHGRINHGEQILDDRYRREPVSYFCHDTGIGRAMLAEAGAPRRIGILGLGCGTLAAYGRAGDTIRIYEINPLVLEIARRDFSYLSDTPAHVETVLGDGRLSLERESSQQFDILVMDAFSGDSVPVHLITEEAFRTYLRHLHPGGILAVNISNKHLDLRPVMERAAAQYGRAARYYSFDSGDDDPLCLSADWVLILDQAAERAHPSLQAASRVLQHYDGFRPWTDDFSNMFRILK